MAESSNIKARDIVKGVFSSVAPVTMNSVGSARSVVSDVRNIGRKINTNMRQSMMQIDKSQPGRKAIAMFNAAKQSLTDGTYEINQANDGMYNDFEELESNFTIDNMTEDERASSSPEEIILRGNRGIAQSVIRASTAQLEGMDAVSSKVLRGFIKTSEASSKSINATIIYSTNIMSAQLGTVNTKLDSINANLVNLIEYQNENTTTYYEKNLEMMNSMLKSMNNLDAMSRGKSARDLKNFDVRSGFNIKEYVERVKKGIKNSTMVSGAGMITSMTNMAKENPDIMSMGELIGNGIAAVASLIPGIGPKMQTITNLDKRAFKYINEALYKIGDKLSNNLIASVFGLDSLGNQRRRVYGIDMSNYMKEQLPWNGKAQKALTEVIPELLTSIDAGINNSDKRYFDYDQGYFKSREEIEKNFSDQMYTSISLEFTDLMEKLGKKFDLSGKSAEESAAAKDKLSNIINKRLFGEGDITTARQEVADLLQSMNLSVEEFSSAFNSIENSISNVVDQMAEFYSRIGSSDSIFRTINNRSGATSRNAIGREAFRILKDHRISGKEDTSLFLNTISVDVKDTIDYITKVIKADIPEFRMTSQYKQYINMAVRRGDTDTEIARVIKDTFTKENIAEIGKKKAFKLMGTDYKASIVNPTNDEIDLGRFGNAIDISMLQGVYGIKTNYSNLKDESQRFFDQSDLRNKLELINQSSDDEEWKKWAGRKTTITHYLDLLFPNRSSISKLINRFKWHPRSKDGVGDTTLTNKAASSQRSRLDGKSAGAEAAHEKILPSEGMSSEFPINQQTENLKESVIEMVTQPADKSLNADESSLKREEALRDTTAKAIIDIGKEGSSSFGGALKNVMDTMVLSMGSMMSSFTSFGSRLFGKEGVIKNFFKSEDFKSGMSKVKEALIGDEKGIFKDQWAKAKKFGKETWDKTKDKLTDVYDWGYRNYSIYKYDENYEENEEWKNSELMQKLNLKKRREEKKAKLAAEEAEKLKSSENPIDTSTDKPTEGASIEDTESAAMKEIKKTTEQVSEKVAEGKSSVDQVAAETPVVLKESVEKIADAGTEAAQDLKESTEKITTAMVEDPNAKPEDIKKKYAKSFMDKVRGILPKVGAGAILGAGIGFLNGAGGASLLGSMFLPTGLIGGAIVGGGLTILSQTEAFRSMMFGKKDENGNRSGGLISKNLKEKFKKAAPIAVGGAITGAIGSILKAPIVGGNGFGILGTQLLPGGILGGAIMGMGVGLLKNSETFQNILFGKKDENGERKGTWLTKAFGNMKQKMAGTSPFLKNIIKGGVVGAVTGATLSNMGVLGAAVSAGPIGMGIAGLGIGIAASTQKFQDWLFGTEELDDDGNSLGRKGGMLGRVKNLINANIIEPIAFSFKKNMVELVDWTKDKITLPFRTALGPIIDSLKDIKDNIIEFFKNMLTNIGKSITDLLKNTISKLFSPITSIIGKIGSAMIGGAKTSLQIAATPLAIGLQGLNVLTMGKRRKDYKEYRKAYLAQEEAGGMGNRLREYWDAKRQDGQKVGFFDQISDTIDAYMGRGEIAESFRKGYVQEKTEQGQNNLGWLTAKDEKKQLRIDRRQKNKAFKQWEKVDKYGRKLANEFGGREVELTPAMFEKYKKKFVGLGVNADQINDSADIMDLIYRPSQFKKKAAGDSGRLGELEALSKFRLTDEEKAHMATTEKYQTNVEKLLEEIRDSGKITAEELMFDREMTSYKEDRKRDNKRLRNKLKKAYKTSLWEGRQAINLNDPELYEYDIEGITDEDLQDYAASNFADNNDFKGYLESIGRKMSPNDDRVAYQSAVKVNGLWKRSTGKTSEEKPPESKPDTTEGAVITNNTSPIVDETTTQYEPKSSLNWLNAIEEANKNKKKGKSSEEKPPESKPNTNDTTQAAVLNELKQTRELQETNLELQSGGEITADKVKKNGYKDFGKSKMSKFSIGGVLTNLFNRKSKEDKTKEAAAKEAEEQKQATALGDETNQTGEKSENATIIKEGETKEKKKSIFSRIGDFIFGGLGTIGAKVNSNPILRTLVKFGKIAIPAILGVSVLDMVRPGTVDKIGASLDEFNKSVDDGSFVENVKTKIVNGVEDITNTVKGFFTETKLGKSMSGVFSSIGKVITETVPTVIINTLERLPEMAGTVANWIGDNAKVLVDTSVDVVEKIGPPLVNALVDSLPTLAYQLGIKLPLEFGKSIFKKLVNTVLKAIGMAPLFKDEELEDNSNLSKTTAETSEKNYQVDKSAEKEYLTPEEAARITEQGGVIRHDSQGMYEEKYVVPTENIAGFDDEGNPIYVNNTGVLGSAAKLGVNAGAQAIRGGGKLTKAVSTMGKVGKVLVKPGQFVLKTAGTISKGAGAFLSNTFGKLPILGIPSKIAGGVFQAEGSILNGLANPVKTVMGTADNPSLISKAVNGIKSVGAKLTDTKLDKIATEKIIGKSATMADDAAKVAADSATSLLAKITTFIKDLKTNKTLLNILDKFKSVIGKEVKPLEVICNFLDDIVKAIGKKCTGKLATKITTMLSKGLAKFGATSVPVVTLVSGAWGVTTGAMEAENLFGVDEADGFMVAISAIMKGLLSISFGCIFDLLFEIASAFLDRDIKQEIAMKLYKLLTAASPKKYEDLINSQSNQDMERQIYNKLYGLNLDADAYNDLDNSKVIDSIGRGISNTWYTITGQNDKKTISTKNMNEAVSYLHSAGYSDDQISSMNASQLKSAVNSASGGKLSFGSGPNANAKIVYGNPYAQGNSEWANMPIGTFANGKVSTMGTGGCGPTALSTIANMFGKGTINPGTVGAYAARNGYITDGGANEDLFTKGAAGLGLAGAKVSGSNFNTALNSGMPMAISGKNSGPFTKAGHVVVAKGTDKNGNINIIDPIDGKLKKYSKSSITSGMTNAWAYDKPIGYGPVSTLKNVITNGLSDETKKMIVNNLGLVQNAISNVPQIMLDTMEGVFKVAAKAIVTPIAVPIEFAVKSLGIIGKLIAGDTSYLTTEEIHSSSNTTSMLTKMSNSLRKTYSSSTAKVSTSKVSVNKLRSTTNKTSNNTNILTKAWNWITGKSKKAGNGYGSIGYGPTNTNGLFMPTLSMPGMNNNLAKINNGQAGPVSYEHIYDENYKHGLSMGLSSAQASDAANAQAASTWKKTTGNDTPSSITNTKGSSTEGIKYNTADGKPKSKSSSSNQTTDDSVVLSDDISDTSTEMSGWEKAKEALSGPVTTLGGLVGGLKQFGNVMSALFGSIIGEGTFMDLLNGNKEDTAAGNTVTSSGVTLSSDAEKELIWKTLINEGYSKQAAAAIMGCWQAESHNKARVIEANWISEFPGYNVVPADRDALDNFTRNGVFKKTKNVKKSAYYNSADNRYYPGIGYAQWTGPRAYNMLNYMSKNRYNWDDPESQIKWFDYEMNGSYKGTKDNLKRATTVTMATKRFFNGYEMGKDADTKYPNMYNTRLNYAKQIYNMYNKSSVGNGKGAVGFGPDEDKGPSNWSEFLSGASAATDYLQSRLNEMGIGEYLNISNPMASITDESGVSSSVSFDPSMWKNSPDQLKPVNAMKSIYGQLNYSQDNTKQNPEKGASSCASTVAWAYNKALGIRPGDTVSRDAYMSSTAQSKDNRFTTIWTNNGSGLTDDFVKNYMQPGDIVYQNWNQSYNNGEMRHTEMYAGNGQTLSHGGPNWSDKGPVYKNLLSNSRKKHTMMIRRYNGFLNNNTTGYGQGSSNDRLTLENNFLREVDEQKNRVNKTRLGKEGDRTVGFGPGSDTSNLEERLDKIFNVITEWYLMEKKKCNTKGFGPGTVTNTTVVNNDNSTKVIKTPEKKQTKVDFNSNLDKLTQKHSAFARMYKSGV